MPRPLKPRRAFSPEEAAAAEALAACSFTPGCAPKRFARGMLELVRLDPCPGITEAQAALLRRLVHTYRRQIPADVALALNRSGLNRSGPVSHRAFLEPARAAAEVLLPHIRRREKAGVFGVFPSTAWRLIPPVDRPFGVTDFHIWAATGILLEDGRLRPMTDDDLVGRYVILPRYWPDPRPLMLAHPQLPLPTA